MLTVGPKEDVDPIDPMSLRFVGPATAEVLEAAPFGASDIAAKRVSYRDLLDAGVNPGVAERLRRENRLVWTFVWNLNDGDLARRAEQLRVLNPTERAWIAASADGHEDTPIEAPDENPPETDTIPSLQNRDWPAVDPDERSTDIKPDVCPRCEGEIVTYTLGDTESEFCDSCGFVGVAADLGSDTPVWKTVVNRLLKGDI